MEHLALMSGRKYNMNYKKERKKKIAQAITLIPLLLVKPLNGKI
jgi:hypothetical protein